MKPARLLIPMTTFALGLAVVRTAGAQMPHDSMKNHRADSIGRSTQHWHFDGKVSTVDQGAHRITINADSIPQQMGGQTTLPYDVPASESLDNYHVGDVVNGDLVVRNNRSRVENVKLGPTPENSAMRGGRRGRMHRDRGPAVSGERTDSARKSDYRKSEYQRDKSEYKAGKYKDHKAGMGGEQRHHFQGVVSTVDGNKITINAEGIPGLENGTTTLPYAIKNGSDSFKVGDKVTGDMIVRNNRTFVENVQHADGQDSSRSQPQ